MKINILLKTTFVKQDREEQDAHIKTRAREITNEHDIGDVISDSNNEILKDIYSFLIRFIPEDHNALRAIVP